MPKKLQRNFTARSAIIGTEVDDETKCTHATLWWNVLFQALVDSQNLENPNVTRSNQAREAIKWIFENRKDFETVCGLSTFIVVASFTESKTPVGYNLKDFWSSHEEIETAEVTYKNHLQRDDLYSASICRVITSTDYD